MKKATLVIISLIAGFVIGFEIKNSYRRSMFVTAEWDKPPVLVVCENSSVSSDRVFEAVMYWDKKNFHIKDIYFDYNNFYCSTLNKDGYIYLIDDYGNIPSDALASTDRNSTGLYMNYAIIETRSDSCNDKLLLEHELGHAFGLSHVDKIGHIMHPEYNLMGEKFWIP